MALSGPHCTRPLDVAGPVHQIPLTVRPVQPRQTKTYQIKTIKSSKMIKQHYLDEVDFTLRTASIFDVPFIFNLILEGAEEGVVTEKFLEMKGPQRLLWTVISGVLLQTRLFKQPPFLANWYVVTRTNGEDLGFLKTTTSTDCHQNWHLDLLFIAPKYRNNGIGTAVIREFITHAPNGVCVVVNCTKYARVMQHVLKKSGFHRKHLVMQGHSLEQYAYINSQTK